VLLVLGVLVAGALVALLWTSGAGAPRRSVEAQQPPRASAAPGPRAPEGAGLAPERSAATESPAPEPAARTTAPAAEPRLGPAAPPAGDLHRFEGVGSLRGHVEVSGNGPFPHDWTLELEPSRFLSDQGHPIERRVALSGVQDFDVEGLPFGGYDVRVLADGWNSLISPVLIDRSSPTPFMNLEIRPAGRLEGRVLGADGLPAPGVHVHLDPLAEKAASREVETGVLGGFAFDDVLDGDYRLVLGDPNAPLSDPLSISFQAPGMVLPDVDLPPLGRAEILVTDRFGAPLADASVRGSGSNGGTIGGATGPDGKLGVAYLPAGTYRIRVDVEGHETRRASFRVTVEQPAQVQLTLE